MSIEFGPKIACSYCGAPKGKSNHWFRAWPERSHTIRYETRSGDVVRLCRAIIIAILDQDQIESGNDVLLGEQHACGLECLGKLVLLMASRDLIKGGGDNVSKADCAHGSEHSTAPDSAGRPGAIAK